MGFRKNVEINITHLSWSILLRGLEPSVAYDLLKLKSDKNETNHDLTNETI